MLGWSRNTKLFCQLYLSELHISRELRNPVDTLQKPTERPQKPPLAPVPCYIGENLMGIILI